MRKTIQFFLFVLFSLAISQDGVTAMNKPFTQMNAVFGLESDLKQFPGLSEEEVAKILKDNGYNAVFGGYENPRLRKALHNEGIKIYAEIGLFVGHENWKDHPESRPVTRDGTLMEKEDWYGGVCPNQSWLREKKLAAMQKLCRDNQVDGIWLDFIRYPCHWEGKKPKLIDTCFCPVCLKKFQAETGIKIPFQLKTTKDKASWILSNHSNQWYQWRCQVITHYVIEARKTIKKENPNVVVGLFGVPWLPSDHNNAIYRIIGQDYKGLAHYVDVFSPMVYHRICYQNPEWIHLVSKNIAVTTGKPVVPIIQACSIPDTLSEGEYIHSLNEARKPPSSGVIIFTLDYALKEKKFNLIKSGL
jgi:hypothetical protein